MRNNSGPPMTLANMRENGVRAVTATCEACSHKADANVDALHETVTGPKGRLAPTVQQLRREARLDPARLAYGPARGRSRLSAARHDPARMASRLHVRRSRKQQAISQTSAIWQKP
jgi:hypothetical protein